MLQPDAPVIVGPGQVTHLPEHGEAPSPLELMAEAARRSAQDAGANGDRLLSRAESVAVVDCLSWPVPDPGRPLAELLALQPRETVRSVVGGTSPIELLADACARIQAGELEVALIAGAEAVNPFMRAMREQRPTGWPEQPADAAPTRLVGVDRPASHPAEHAAGLIAPISYYPLFESAVRTAAARTPDAHQAWLGRLWSRFAEVAGDNPYAWRRDALGAEEIALASPANRMAALPYPKFMTANIQVDQGAALLVCSAAAAEAAGVPRERWVFVHAAAFANDHWFAVEREALHRSPAIAACGRAALEHAGVAIDDVAHLDLYSCFPSAVQVAARELGIDLESDPRPPTVTGGLTFAGGPGSNYVTHALAALTGRLREDPGATGICTGVGWYLSKHAIAVLAAAPPRTPFAHLTPQGQVDALPARAVADGAGGEAPIEAYTAVYDREGTPTLGIVSAVLGDGRRALARSEDRNTVAELVAEEAVGRPARLGPDAGFEL